MLHEFDHMFLGEDMVAQISTKWIEMVPKLCQLRNIQNVTIDDQEVHFTALKILDTKLKKSGQGKQPSALSMFEVKCKSMIAKH